MLNHKRADWKRSARFSFAERVRLGSVGGVQTRAGRWVLAGMLVFSAAFAAWTWLRPYEWGPDPKAKAEIVGVELRRDHSYYWLTVHVRAKGDEPLDLSVPTRLVVRKEGDVQPADTRVGGAPESGFREAWFQFWLESGQVSGPLTLGLQGGSLSVKSSGEMPKLANGTSRHYTTHRW